VRPPAHRLADLTPAELEIAWPADDCRSIIREFAAATAAFKHPDVRS
jgi:hypothetical protein